LMIVSHHIPGMVWLYIVFGFIINQPELKIEDYV
jgi:hypothetical protein